MYSIKFKLLFLLICIISCTSAKHKPSYNVEYKGALKSIMHNGDLSANANLRDFQQSQNLYALGALEKLKGEILILNSKPFISRLQNDRLTIDDSFDHQATLFVYASVKKWNSIPIPNPISNLQEVEKFIESTAEEQGIDVDQAFPFMISGNAKSFRWHVIDWAEGDNDHSHEKHIQSGPHGTVNDREVEILGFYSNHHHAIFTHHTTNMHMHVKTSDNQLAGHLDDLILGSGMMLKLPVE